MDWSIQREIILVIILIVLYFIKLRIVKEKKFFPISDVFYKSELIKYIYGYSMLS